VNYTYDGDGDRVQKSNGKIYWFGAGSEILDESDSSGNITDEYIFFGGKRIAHRVVSGNAIYYYAEDFLGSSRVMTTSTGTVCYDADFYPYGGERVVTNTCPQNYKFTGKERDAETNNDDFGARYYSSQFGRWISPDWSAIPAPVPYANLTNPQTLNLYAMVHDNPETFSDLDGHDGAMGQAGKVEVNNQPENPTEAKQSQDPNTSQSPTQDKKPVLPADPSGLGPEWKDVTPQDKKNPDNPKIPRRFRGPNGVEIEFDPAKPDARPGTHGEQGHWHEIDPTGHRVGDYLRPGSPFPERSPAPSGPSAFERMGNFVSDHRTAIVGTALVIGAIALAPATGGASLVLAIP
ncbi:MAG TPA: RHS repeat-associated core domain-containing protein, partial [Candidatus Acidoferrales bacterium]|nr:RHS repeat-associated core domain-containing protein [Candidatus Acidoferrales bacterium]